MGSIKSQMRAALSGGLALVHLLTMPRLIALAKATVRIFSASGVARIPALIGQAFESTEPIKRRGQGWSEAVFQKRVEPRGIVFQMSRERARPVDTFAWMACHTGASSALAVSHVGLYVGPSPKSRQGEPGNGASFRWTRAVIAAIARVDHFGSRGSGPQTSIAGWGLTERD